MTSLSEGPNHTDVAEVYKSIGSLHIDQGNFDKALAAAHKVVDICTNVHGPYHSSVLGAHAQIQIVLEKQGKLGQSQIQLEKVAAVLLKGGGGHDCTTSTAGLLSKQADLLMQQGVHDKAMLYYEKALARTA